MEIKRIWSSKYGGAFQKILTPIFVFFAILFIMPVYCTAAGTSNSLQQKSRKKWVIEYTISGGLQDTTATDYK